MKNIKRREKMILYAIDINTMVTTKQYRSFCSMVSTTTRHKIRKFVLNSDKKRALFGEILARYVIAKEMNVAYKHIILDKDVNGKPYCKSNPEIQFNISHSGTWVICVLSRKPIGVDIERIGLVYLQIAKRFFASREYYEVLRQQENRAELFYKLWTLKESYIKYTGKGLSTPLSSVEFVLENNRIELISLKKNAPHFISEKIFENYCVSVCSEEMYEMIEVRQITLKEIDNYCKYIV